MSILSDFEDRVASAVEGLFAGAFRSPVQPAEVAKALARAMDDRRRVGVSHVYAPTSYTVALSRDDAEELGGFARTLAAELGTYLTGYARERRYHLASHPTVTFAVHDDLRLGRFRVSAELASAPKDQEPSESTARNVHALATVTVSDSQHDVVLKGDRAVIGRLAGCVICLQDANVSREHAAFVRDGNGWAIVDLDSTNGTRVNGKAVERAHLRDADRIQVGATELVYHEPRR